MFDFAKIFAPSKPLEFLGFALVSFMVALVTGDNPIRIAVGLSTLFLFFLVWLWVERNRRLRATISVSRGEPKPAKGLILLMSPYNPRAQTAPQRIAILEKIIPLIEAERLTKAQLEDINFFQSNIVPQINAIAYHMAQGQLRDIWLICTTSENNPTGSRTSASLLQKYMDLNYPGAPIKIHEGPQFTVHEQDYEDLWRTTEKIFRTSGYREDVIIADVTGGTKMMSVTMAMACVPRYRNLQYMDAQRDWQGNHLDLGEMTPVVVNFDPILYQEQTDKNQAIK